MSLSDKFLLLMREHWYSEKDVREAVKELKEELCQRPIYKMGTKDNYCDICINCKTINEIFGDKLI